MFFGLSGILKHCFLNVVFLNHLFLMHVVFWVSPLLWIAFEALLIYLFILLPIEYDTWNVTFACSSQAMHLFFLLLEDFGWESWFSPKSNICSTLSLEVMFPRHVAKCTKVKVLWRRLQHSAKNIRWTNCCSKKDIYIFLWYEQCWQVPVHCSFPECLMNFAANIPNHLRNWLNVDPLTSRVLKLEVLVFLWLSAYGLARWLCIRW